MSSVPIHYIDLRAFSYATEDEHRVETALRTLLPEDAEIDRDETEGFHGDPIVVLSIRIETADEIRAVLDRLKELDALPSILEELEERVDDDCAFYVQLDKQAAFRGSISRGKGIMVRIKIEAYPAKKPLAIENLQRAFSA